MNGTKSVTTSQKKAYAKRQETVFITKSHYVGEKSITEVFEQVLMRNSVAANLPIAKAEVYSEKSHQAAAI